MISKISPENNVDTAVPQAVNRPNSIVTDSMDMEIQESTIKVVKANQHLVKLVLNNEPEKYEVVIEKIKKIIFENLKSNYINIYFHRNERSICCSFENGEIASAFANLEFLHVGIDCVAKMLTDNAELDKRKVKLIRPSTGKLNINDLKSSLIRFGEIDEFYEIRTNERKRTFVIAFKEEESKRCILNHDHVFLGNCCRNFPCFRNETR